MAKDPDIAQLRAKADKYRMLARWISDRETIARVIEFSLELEDQALAKESPAEDEIRKRAHQFWERSDRPVGRTASSGTEPNANCGRP
ncbi:hypothetical protein [Bradyrhizobium genosp. P]|uniref:hypothetical protein n=1 Tax=Bradyrhizobium genosp. P TaxID=83641 RepID=UPI003CF5680D